ncbi:hydroxypyruvate isomerase family protein [Rhizobium leguminosarum]|uniref:hydroxypyruvate isomerase family protein n=1 Tax=Rhizobium leguminosarum TaxID=384 RepID=UPI0019543946|nr:TIM barrel protein [Rhizobium leguminosarum]
MQNRFSAHIGYLFSDLPLKERIAAAAGVGFTAIEHPLPFSIPPAEMRDTLRRYGLSFSQLSGGTGDASKGEKGLAALPGREIEFREGFNRAVDYAVAVGSPYVHPMAGVPGAASPDHVHDVYRDNIHYAVERTSNTTIKLLIEAISEISIPGYAMPTLEQACNVQDVFGPGNVSLLVDTFHAQANGIKTQDWVVANIHRIGHIHIADYPGRHEPGTGMIDFDAILEALAAHDYHGAIGFEYIPSTSTEHTTAFLSAWKSKQLHQLVP